MLQNFYNVNYNKSEREFNVAKIIKIQLMRIKLCFVVIQNLDIVVTIFICTINNSINAI